jgi:hypothetical protein
MSDLPPTTTSLSPVAHLRAGNAACKGLDSARYLTESELIEIEQAVAAMTVLGARVGLLIAEIRDERRVA